MTEFDQPDLFDTSDNEYSSPQPVPAEELWSLVTEQDTSATSFAGDDLPGDVTADPAEPTEAEIPAGPSLGQQIWGAVKETLETIVPAVLIALLINLFLAQATRVYGQSMEPNLHTDQRLVVEKVSYKFHAPQRDDVVVLKVRDDADELLIKRVIGLPGETVEVKEGHVYINGQMLDEPYLSQPTRGHYGPVYVPPLSVLVLGDNRGASNDSRSFGTIPLDNIMGKAWFSYWPLEDVGMVK